MHRHYLTLAGLAQLNFRTWVRVLPWLARAMLCWPGYLPLDSVLVKLACA